MSTSRILPGLIALALILSAPVELPAQENRDRLERKLTRQESRVRNTAATAAEKYADWCADCGAFAEARRYLNVAAVLTKDDFGGRDFEPLRGRADEVDEDYEEEIERQRERLLKGGESLLDFVVSARKQDGDDFCREVSSIWLLFFHDAEALADKGWVYEPNIGRIMPREDADRYESDARYNGEWLDAEAVEAHNKAHASFDNPTELSDGTLRLMSELPLRESLRLMNYVSRFRVFLLSQLGGELNLRHPEEVLSVFAARNRETYNRQGEKICEGQGTRWRKTYESGKYVGVIGQTMCPILFSPYIPTGDDSAILAEEPTVYGIVRHEMAHMLVTEGLKYKESRRWTKTPEGPPRYYAWVKEGIATWVEDYYWNDDELAFTYEVRRKIPLNKEHGKAGETRFERLMKMKDRIRDVDSFAGITDGEFQQGGLDAYAQACAQSVFLMRHSADTREKFFELVRLVHIAEHTKDSFNEIFEDVDMTELNRSFREWIDGIEFVE